MKNEWENEINKIKQVFDWKEELKKEVIYSILYNKKYVENLFVSRNIPEYLRVIFNNPTKSSLEMPLEEAQKLFNDIWKEYFANLQYIKNRDAYEQKYKVYFNHNKRKELNCRFIKGISPDDFREVYLDNISTTKIRPEVQKVISDYAKGEYGYANPSSITVQGEYATDLIKKARIKIANVINSNPEEIYFTSCGSEGNNLAIKGLAFNYLKEKGHIITSEAEHDSVLQAMKFLEDIGFEITYLTPNKYGFISTDSIYENIKRNTIIVSIMAANNEIGTIYPIKEIGALCADNNIHFVVDGVQAYTKIPIDMNDMNITGFTFSAHKINGPKGIGGIYIKRGTKLTPLIHGGGQERGIRSGTENIGYIMAFGKASEIAHCEMESKNKTLAFLSDKLLKGLNDIDKDLIIFSPKNRLNNLLCVGFRNIKANSLIRSLNKIGISVSSGSACSSKNMKPSHVMEAIGADIENTATIRFGLGYDTTESDIDYVLKYLSEFNFSL